MKFFFGVSDNPAHLKYIPPVDVMISAYRFKFLINRRYAKKYLNRAESIFVDSGFISAWKAGTWKRWLDKQDYVLSCAKKAKADIVAMLDLPMEPKLLAKNGFLAEDALNITINNAAFFMKAKTKATKVFVVQGYQEHEYLQCIEAYQKLGIFEQKNIWIGIGSVCMRTPEAGLYRIAKLIRQEVPDHHLHCFGIGKISWVKELEQIGIDSCDSSVASVCTAYNKLFINDSQFQLPKITYRNQEIAALQFAYNVQSTLAQLSGHQSKWIRKPKPDTTQLSLF